ncbi:DUF1684 domain-containing protein [Corallincola platygyrae]|uniref:DUF1684 domain-containing protein n=1 Tax=Corallincola platygyrae TaxID=1193278 RepID=A0ABW4XJL8_9GAMM
MLNRSVAVLASLSAVISISACSPTITEEQLKAADEWAAWVEAENAQTRDPERSFLNILDAVYMRPGDNAVLDLSALSESIRWYKQDDEYQIAPNDRLQLSFDGENVLISALGKYTPFSSDQKYPLPNDSLFVTTGQLHDNGLRAFIRDPNHAKVVNFAGHNYYEYNFDARVEGEFIPAKEHKTVSFQTVQGLTNTLVKVGKVTFEYQGDEMSLSAYHGDGKAPMDYLLFLFKDKTNGDTTYGGGRELVVNLPKDGSKTFVVDFNRTFNLNCAHSTFWNCPIIWDPSLDVAIEAGEKLPHGYDS